MYPHERSLVADMQGRPFALLGINSDPIEKVKSALQRENITWRSWWDGGNTSGPIAKQYGVRGWPTIYVLDQDGVIRYKNVRGPAMDEAVETLLADLGSGGVRGMRMFKDKTGTYEINAKFVEFKDGKARLEKEDGEIVEVEMSKLSDDDQTYIRNKLKNKRD